MGVFDDCTDSDRNRNMDHYEETEHVDFGSSFIWAQINWFQWQFFSSLVMLFLSSTFVYLDFFNGNKIMRCFVFAVL